MKQTALFAAIAAICIATSTTSFAVALDLAGVDRTVTDVADLASYDEGVMNSSSTLATLTFDISDDQTYSGVLGGKLVEFKYFTNEAAEKGNILGRKDPDAETVEQALAYRTALARRPDWNHPIDVTVVEVCGNTGYNWFDLPVGIIVR